MRRVGNVKSITYPTKEEQGTALAETPLPQLVRARDLVKPKGPLPVSSRCLLLWAEKDLVPSYRVAGTVMFNPQAVFAALERGAK